MIIIQKTQQKEPILYHLLLFLPHSKSPIQCILKKKKKPFYSQESSDQPTTSQVELEKKWRTKHKTQPPPLHIIYVTNNQRVVGKLEEKAKCKNKERSKSSGHKEGGGIGWRTWGRCISSWNPSCCHRQHGNHQNQEKLHLWCLHCSKKFLFFCCCCRFCWERRFLRQWWVVVVAVVGKQVDALGNLI